MSISQAPVVFVAKPTALLDSEPKSDRPTRSQSRWASQMDDLFFAGIDNTVVQEQKKRLNIDDKLFHPDELPKASPRGAPSSSSSAGAPDATVTVTASATTAIAFAMSPAKIEALTRHPSPRRQSTPVPALAVTSVMPATPAIVAPVQTTLHITPPHSRTPSPQPQIQVTCPSPQLSRLALPSDSISLASNAPMTAPALQVNPGGPVRGHVRAVSGGHTSSVVTSPASSTTTSAASTPTHSRSPSSGSSSTSSATHSRQPSGDRRKSLVNVQPLQRRNPTELHVIDLWLKAAAAGNIVEMKKLLQTQSQFVTVNSINEEGQTALGVAVAAKQVDIVKALLQVSTLDPNIKDLVGHTPLHVGAKIGRQRDPDGDSEKMVLTRDLNILNGQWIPPIDKENEEEDKVVEIVRLLCADKRVDVNAKDYFFCSALVLACAVGNLRVVYTLVKSGAAVNTNTATLVTPLHTACEKGYKEIVKLLVSRGAKVDVKDKDGYTPLHLAAQKSFVVICKILKRAGADVYAQTNTTYKTPMDLATSEQLKNYLLGMKTSESDPLQVDWISYETNDSTLVLVNNIGMCMVPGRNKKIHRRNIDADLKVLVDQNTDVLVSLIQNPELEMMGIPHFFDKVKAYGIQSIHYPIPDKWLPNSMDEVSELANRIIELLHRGKRIVVHCNGGKGRTALVVVSVLVSLGMSAGEATDLVRATRPGTLYNPAQIIYVRALGLYRG